ncbi:DUF5916 domain-containing protein [Gemmatimonadota bacterium]
MASRTSRIEKNFSIALLITLLLPALVGTTAGQQVPVRPATAGTMADPHLLPRTETRPRIDGEVTENLWNRALMIPLEVEVSPGENIPAPVRTFVQLIHDDTHLYAAFRCFDPDPSEIRAHLSDRDALGNDDWVGIVLDTFNDERRSFMLMSNPLGVQGDLIEAESGGDRPQDDSWDMAWASAGILTDDGWQVEMAIPFNQLRFQRTEGPQIWGFDAVRRYPRSQDHLIGSFPRDRSNNIYLSQALKIKGFDGVSPGHAVELIPTITGVRTDIRDPMPSGSFRKDNQDFEAGITMSLEITPNMVLNGTVNPDFSQVEADARQLDINQPFALYYRERRPFFVEGADYFDTLKDVIYTRTIRNPDYGLKLTGKEGANTIGAYAARDEVTNLIFPGSQGSGSTSLQTESTAAVLRYRRDLGRRSTVGALATLREADGYANRVGGIDGDIRLSPTDQIQFQVLTSVTDYPDATALANGQETGDFSGNYYAFEYDHNSRTAGWWLDYDYVTSGFRADLGFIPRVDFRNLEGGWSWNWNPGPDSWWSVLRIGGQASYYEDQAGNMLEQGASLWGFYAGPMQSSLMISGARFREEFQSSTYDLTSFEVGGSFRPTGDLRIGLQTIFGDRIDYANNRPGEQFLLSAFADWNLGRHLNLVMSQMLERLKVPDGRLYTANISQLGAVWQFNVRTFLRAIVQHVDYDRNTDLYLFPIDREYRNLTSQLLFSYTINPRTVLYLGYNDSHLGSEAFSLTRQEKTFFMKLGYSWFL